MKNKKILYILGICIAVIFVGVGTFFSIRKNPEQTNTELGELPVNENTEDDSSKNEEEEFVAPSDNDYAQDIVKRDSVPSVLSLFDFTLTATATQVEHCHGAKLLTADSDFDRIHLSDGTIIDVNPLIKENGYDIYQYENGIEIISKDINYDITIVPVYKGDVDIIGNDLDEKMETYDYKSSLTSKLADIESEYQYQYSLSTDRYSYEDEGIYSYDAYRNFITNNKLENNVNLYSENQKKEIFARVFRDIDNETLKKYSTGLDSKTISSKTAKYVQGSNYITYSEENPTTDLTYYASYLYFMYDDNMCYAVRLNVEKSYDEGRDLLVLPFDQVTIARPDSQIGYDLGGTFEELGYTDEYSVVSTEDADVKTK